jgi:hypothetical protein
MKKLNKNIHAKNTRKQDKNTPSDERHAVKN